MATSGRKWTLAAGLSLGVALACALTMFAQARAAEAAVNHLVVSEVYLTDSAHAYNRDFLEIFNPTATTVSLANLRISNAEFAADEEGQTYAFPAGAAIGPGQVIVIAHRATAATGYSFRERFGFLPTYEIVDSTAAVPNMVLDANYGQGVVSFFAAFNLADDGVAILDASQDYAVVDALTWSTARYATQPFTGSIPANASLERAPADYDTDDCSRDCSVRAAPAPGSVLVLGESPVRLYRVDYGTGARFAAHPFGLWNNPYAAGVEAYNYNTPQAYTSATVPFFGPHGGYATTSHRCRECHAVHRASGAFKLTRADSRVDACEWCHGTGAGSAYNIQTDNDDARTREYNAGHTMGFGSDAGRWKAPDDTDPAYTPPYYRGGFSCLDCHSPHANPDRVMMDIVEHREPYTITLLTRGRFMLVKDPDGETTGGPVIADTDTSTTVNGFPVNKVKIDWDNPFGPNDKGSSQGGGDPNYYNPADRSFVLSELCADCHDGNVGFHTQPARMYSEELASLGEPDPYRVGYGHDSNPRHAGAKQMEYGPLDGQLFGPSCLNCHRGASQCSNCHGPGKMAYSTQPNVVGATAFSPDGFWKKERWVSWPIDWVDASTTVNPACADDGFSFPHRTLGFRLLKDELFGLDFDGATVAPNATRTTTASAPTSIAGQPAHNIDSACLDCHNPAIWNPQYPNELILKGLP